MHFLLRSTQRPPSTTLFPYTTLFRSNYPLIGDPELKIAKLYDMLPEGAGSSSTGRSEEHTSELQSRRDLVCRLLLEKKKNRCSGLDLLWSVYNSRGAWSEKRQVPSRQ